MDEDSKLVEILLDCEGCEPVYSINGQNYQLAILALRAHLDSGMSSEEWNTKSEDERKVMIQAQIDKLRGAGPN